MCLFHFRNLWYIGVIGSCMSFVFFVNDFVINHAVVFSILELFHICHVGPFCRRLYCMGFSHCWRPYGCRKLLKSPSFERGKISLAIIPQWHLLFYNNNEWYRSQCIRVFFLEEPLSGTLETKGFESLWHKKFQTSKQWYVELLRDIAIVTEWENVHGRTC